MKKGLTVVLIISMLFTMSACTKKDNSRKTDGKNEKNESVENESVETGSVNSNSVKNDSLIVNSAVIGGADKEQYMIVGGADNKQDLFVSDDKKGSVDRIPVVKYEDKKIYINGNYYATSEKFGVFRIDEYVISFSTDEGLVNLTADGEEIKLKDLIIDRAQFEATVGLMLSFEIAKKNIDIYSKCYNFEKVEKEKLPYDEAMKQSFYMDYRGVNIIFPDETSGLSLSVTYGYDSELFNPDYRPGKGITCFDDMIGRVGTFTPGLIKEGYIDHWAEDALEIRNFNGADYIWYCISYTDKDEKKVYYSSIVKENDDAKDEVIYSEKVDGPFVCCNIQEFSEIMQNIEPKTASREYFENLDKDSSLEDIVKDIGRYGIKGSGILYHVWHLDDGSEALVVFDSKGRIVRIYIQSDDKEELLYVREY
jgi:hypothetical protein